ncbi:MAG: 23S rRNA (adenine(2503)-C(2))-methyltransferase RlmN [Puniceicoccaceae bacterium]
MKFRPQKPSVLDHTPESLGEDLRAHGFPAFRTKQVLDWVFKKGVAEFPRMTNLPDDLRRWLAGRFGGNPVEPVFWKQSGDETHKLLARLEDGSYIETVLIEAPMVGVGRESSRSTVCVSSQVGCAYGCRFCASGLAGWKRNLTRGEILGQFLRVGERRAGMPGKTVRNDHVPFDNIVFMGMGEPLANFDALVGALESLHSDWGFRFGARRITVSTSGLVPEIRGLADLGIPIRLAVSLHGATDEVRGRIMPVNRKYPLAELTEAIRYFRARHNRMVTLEFILIEDVNDSLDQARRLADLAKDLHAHVNCIPYNTVEGLPWKRPNLKRQEKFARILAGAGVSVTLRREKGHDIDAACGQLRLRREGGENAVSGGRAPSGRVASAPAWGGPCGGAEPRGHSGQG